MREGRGGRGGGEYERRGSREKKRLVCLLLFDSYSFCFLIG